MMYSNLIHNCGHIVEVLGIIENGYNSHCCSLSILKIAMGHGYD